MRSSPLKCHPIALACSLASTVLGLVASCSSGPFPVVVRSRLSLPQELSGPPIEERRSLFLLLAPLEPEPLWEQTANLIRHQREGGAADCRSWNDEGVYRLLLALKKRAGTARETALPLFDRARLLCPDNARIEDNYRSAFASGPREAGGSP